MELQAMEDVIQLVNTQPALVAPTTSTTKKTKAFEAIDLTHLSTEVRIFGYIAETTMTMTFTNPHNQELAGDLYFPLPEGAAVSGYALDIDGVMVEGVVVGKAKGRRVFEKIVREGVDPGLVEWTKGNNFKTRVYPIPARGQRTVTVSYISDLLTTADGTAYHLPLNYNDTVSNFSLRVEVVKTKSVPLVRKSGLTSFNFEKWQDSFVARVKMEDVVLAEDLIIAVPDAGKQNVMVERAPDGDYYFCINDFPVLPEPEPVSAPETITVLWDASGSRANADHTKELDILRSYFGQFSDQIIEVNLVCFRHRAEEGKLFRIENGNCEVLIAEIEHVQYDGGTQMACISPQNDDPKPDFHLLFTDGLSNFGQENPEGFEQPVYIFCSTATANHSFMRYLAMTTAGEYFNLQRVESTGAVAAIGRRSFGYLSAEADPKKIDGVWPVNPQPVQGRFHLAGRLIGDEGTVTVDYGGNGNADHQSKFSISRADAAEGSLLKRNWAQKKVDDLMIFAGRNEKEITEIGKKYNIVTPRTSLIVLDSLDQYIEHEIAPPKSLKKMCKDYEKYVKSRRMQEMEQEDNKIEHILNLWNERVAWWEKEFDYPEDFKYRPRDDDSVMTGDGSDGLGLRLSRADSFNDTIATDLIGGEDGSEELNLMRYISADSEISEWSMSALPMDIEPEGGEPDKYSNESSITVQEWDPDTPYLKKLKECKGEDQVAVYMEQRIIYADSPAFFLDCADFFFKAKEEDFALQIMSNIAELELENPILLRILAHKLEQIDKLDLSILLFEEVVNLRPEEPQSFRDHGLVLGQRAERLFESGDDPEKCKADFSQAIKILYQVVMNQWDRFEEIELIALMEMNRLISKARAAGVDDIPVDPRLVKLLDVDVRIVLTWDADMTDIDLWVTEPSGEKAYYSHPNTVIGGHMSRDITDGYGPEEYILKKAMDGVYLMEANYYGSAAAKLIGAVTLHLGIFTNYGRPNEKHEAITLRLTDVKETIKIGEIKFEAAPIKKRKFAPDEKVAILKRILLDHEDPSDLCKVYGITSEIITDWTRTFFIKGYRAFQDGDVGKNPDLEEKIRQLEEKVNKKNKIIADLIEEKMQL